jgi:hypothetical protein
MVIFADPPHAPDCHYVMKSGDDICVLGKTYSIYLFAYGSMPLICIRIDAAKEFVLLIVESHALPSFLLDGLKTVVSKRCITQKRGGKQLQI